jgi:hypothetical protein
LDGKKMSFSIFEFGHFESVWIIFSKFKIRYGLAVTGSMTYWLSLPHRLVVSLLPFAFNAITPIEPSK